MKSDLNTLRQTEDGRWVPAEPRQLDFSDKLYFFSYYARMWILRAIKKVLRHD